MSNQPTERAPRALPAGVEGFSFEKLAAFQLALEAADMVDEIALGQRRDRPWLARQLGSASLSILNNTAEGLGEYASGDKTRFYRYAVRSAFETAAMIVLLGRKGLISASVEARTRTLLLQVTKTLTRLAVHHQRKKRRP